MNELTKVLIKGKLCVSITINDDFKVSKQEVHQWNFIHESGFIVCERCGKVYGKKVDE